MLHLGSNLAPLKRKWVIVVLDVLSCKLRFSFITMSMYLGQR